MPVAVGVDGGFGEWLGEGDETVCVEAGDDGVGRGIGADCANANALISDLVDAWEGEEGLGGEIVVDAGEPGVGFARKGLGGNGESVVGRRSGGGFGKEGGELDFGS